MADTTKRLSTSLAELYSQRAVEKRYEREQEEQQREYERAMAEQAAAQTAAQAAAQREQNQGGFLGGIGYSLEKIGLGFLSGIDGIWDYAAGGLAKLFGADDWAEQQIANDWVNYNHADEWFNPSEGWQFVGDVAGGIGTSLPAIAGVAAAGAITVASGGTLSPVAATLIAGSIAGLGAAGRATKEAYDQTGELTGKEFGYGALVGVTEGAIEGVSSALGAGTGAVVKSISKSFGKEVAKSATRNTLLKGVVKGFAGEAFEEGVQAILEPVYKRMTYDSNAKNATFQEVAYAALVGGLSGAIMGGGDVAVRNIRGTTRGNTLVNEGKAGDVITTAERISSYQTENQTDYETFQVVQNTLNELKTSLQKTDGEVRTVRQKMLLGVLEQANTSAAFEPIVTASAENIYNNAETVAARLNEFGYRDQNGKPIQITAEQIREGIDTTDANKFRKTMSRALKTNSVLRTLAVADTVGQISMDTARFRDATLAGQQLSTQADLNRFVEQATDAERQAVADRLGIENWETLTNEQFHDKITEFVANGGVKEYQQERSYVKEAQAVAPDAARKHLPRMVNLRNDGIYRYTQGGTDIAITKRGDSYYVYDYESGLTSKALSRTETNRVLREIHTNEQNYQNGVRQHTEAQNRLREQAAEIDAYARENISEYKNLSASGQAAIRATIRQGRAAGVQEDFVLSCARVSARSGLRVVFNKESSFVAANGSYADGAIDLKNNRIIINPEAKSRSGESILIHELTHAIYNDTDGSLTVAEGLETMTDTEKERIRKRYAAVGQGSAVQVSDEINAHFAEQTLSNKNILERLVQKKQTLKEKILGFFKKARADYQGDEKLTGAAARLYRQYKKLFDEFSARNQRYLGTENASAEARAQAHEESLRNSVRFSIQRVGDSDVVVVDTNQDIFDGAERSEYGKIVRNYMKMYFRGQEVDGIKFTSTSEREFTMSHDSQRSYSREDGTYEAKMRAGTELANLIQTGQFLRHEAAKHPHSYNAGGYNRYSVEFVVDNVPFEGQMVIALNGDKAMFYDIVGVKEKEAAQLNRSEPAGVESTSSANSISQNAKNVNAESQKGKKFALPDTDSDGRELTAEQKEFFKNSQIRVAEKDGWAKTISPDGNLLPVYHGTNSGEFTIFDKRAIGSANDSGWYGRGFYFAFDRSEASTYGRNVLECYLNVENPFFFDEEMKFYDGVKYGDVLFDIASFSINLSEKFPSLAKEIKVTAIEDFDDYGSATKHKQLSLYDIGQQVKEVYNDKNLDLIKTADGYSYVYRADIEKVVGDENVAKLIRDKLIFGEYTIDYRLEKGVITEDEAELLHSVFKKYGRMLRDENIRIYAETEASAKKNRLGAALEVVIKRYAYLDLHYTTSYYMEDIAAEFSAAVRKRGHDGIVQSRVGDEVIVFEPNQIKLTSNKAPSVNDDMRFALPDVEQEAVDFFGYTYSWAETGYILTDGSRLDFSGRNEGASGGYRTVDHRDIVQLDKYGEMSETEAMIDFIKRGNIRVIPEGDGINLSVRPTTAQEKALSDFISKKRGEITLDIDNERGETVVSVKYPRGTYSSKVLQDIRNYFESGTKPTISDVQRFRYALPDIEHSEYIRYALPDKRTQNILERGETITVYRAMQIIDGKLYPPMAAKIKNADGSRELVMPSELGRWEQADERPGLIRRGNKFTLDKANGSSIEAAYNPYFHTSRSPLNDQFSSAYKRDNLVTVEGEVPASELTSGYRAQYAKDAVGEMKWHSGPVSSKLPKGKERRVILSRWFKPVRIVPDAEVAQTIADVLNGENIEVPHNTVTPSLLKELEKRGVAIKYDDGSSHFALPETDSTGTRLSQEQREFFKDSKVIDAKGRLLKVYHGTRNPSFTIFKQSGENSALGAGIYFAESREYAREYSFGSEPYQVYLNIVNPYIAEFPGGITQSELIKKGYDGVYNPSNKLWVAFKPEQIKNVSNKKPTNNTDIRFALDGFEDGNAQPRGNYSVGQRARFAANNTGMRVYTKAEAAEVINSIIEERLVFEDIGMYGELRGKDRQAVIDYLFQKLNTVKEGYRGGVALRIADYMIEHTVLTDMYAESNGEVSEAMRKLSVLRRYMHKIDLRHIQDEIQYRFDKKNSINLVWGAKEGGIAPDTLPQLLAEEGIFLDAINEADCFMQMVDMYEDTRAVVDNATEQVMLSTYGDERTIKDLRQQIVRDILIAYDQKGKKSKFARLVEKYTKQIAELKRQLRESNANNRLINSIVDRAQKMRELKLGAFLNASQYKSDIFKNSIESLGKVKFRGNFNIAGTRKIMADLRTWYTKENPLLTDTYEESIAEMLDTVATGTKGYTRDELRMINDIMAYFTNFVEKFNKVYRQGRWVNAVPEATRYIEILHNNAQVKVGLFRKIAGSTYMQTFGDPMSVVRRMDMYASGFYTEMLVELREAAIDAEITEMEIRQDYDAFLKKNRRYLSHAAKQTVEYHGAAVPKMHLISLYMTLKRAHAQAGLAQNGFAFTDSDGKRVRVDGFAPGITEESEIRAAAIEEQAKIAELLTETDKEYIAILEKAFNKDAKKLKADRDMQRLGFTNATEDYYYPIRRGNIAKNVDTADIQGELDRVSSASFNKDTVRGAKQELYIEAADAVFNRHIHAVAQYAALSPAIETYNKLYNLDIGGNANKPVSIATESANTWAKGNRYFSKLISDIQGIPAAASEGMKALSFVRGGYARFQLGANPKVWVTQLSSLFAASSMLDANSIARGMTVSAKDVDTYCPLAKLRARDNTAAMAQGVLDKVGRVSNVLMAPIGKMDRFVIRRLFGACQVQVQKNGGAKIGTEANKVEAGKLLKRVILETQQNSLATERSAAMRSGNEIMRTITMFSADSMKVVGRVIDSVGELSTLKAKLRMTTDAEGQATLRTQIKTARKKVFKSVTALATSALFMAAIAQLFSWLYNKDRDDDETVGQQVFVDFIGNLFGGLPLIRDVYTRIAEGYELDNYAYSALNDLLDSAVNLFDTVGGIVSGEESDAKVASRIKNLAYSIGQIFGIPTRNIYNVFYGLTKRISPTTAYKIDEAFYAKNYVTDLNKAIESDDTDMIAMLTSMIFGERMGNTTMSDAVRDKFVDLYSKGYSVLPRSIGDTISYGGVEIPLTDDEYARFRAIYAQSMKDIERMTNSGAFKVLSEEMQAKAIKQVYDAYYYDALSDLVGVDERTTIGELSEWIDMSKLSVVFTGLSDIEAEKNSKGETISGSKKKNTVKYLLEQNLSDGERLLIFCYRGYIIQDGDYRGYTAKRAKSILLQYILKLKGTQTEKAALAEKCGFTVRNGRIIRDF